MPFTPVGARRRIRGGLGVWGPYPPDLATTVYDEEGGSGWGAYCLACWQQRFAERCETCGNPFDLEASVAKASALPHSLLSSLALSLTHT